MGLAFKGNEFNFGAAAVTLTTALGLSTRIDFSHVVIRAASTNTGVINIGGSTLTTTTNRWGYLAAEESLTIAVEHGFMHSDSVFLIATVSGDDAHIILVS